MLLLLVIAHFPTITAVGLQRIIDVFFYRNLSHGGCVLELLCLSCSDDASWYASSVLLVCSDCSRTKNSFELLLTDVHQIP